MKLNVLNRRVHYWIAVAALLPLAIIISSGLLLQSKKHWAWVQPVEFRGTGTTPVLSLDGILDAVRADRAHGVSSWEDVNRIDVRPDRGVAKVWLRSGYEVQVDLGTGRIMHTAYRRSDLIESIHDGSFFLGDISKLGIFLPAGLVLFVLLVTGAWMAWIPFSNKRRVRRARAGVAAGRQPAALGQQPSGGSR